MVKGAEAHAPTGGNWAYLAWRREGFDLTGTSQFLTLPLPHKSYLFSLEQSQLKLFQPYLCVSDPLSCTAEIMCGDPKANQIRKLNFGFDKVIFN